MNTVFIFGAGASRPSGGPLMSDFMDKAEYVLRSAQYIDPNVKAAFEDVFTALVELQPTYAKAALNFDNFEVLFGAVETAQLIGRFPSREPNKIASLRDSLVTLIVNTLEQSIDFPTTGGGIYAEPPLPYGQFVGMISQLRRNSGQTHDFSFITFNYDIALDYALMIAALKRDINNLDYCLSGRVNPYLSMLLKLHGSVNWGRCEECGAIIPVEVERLEVKRTPGEPQTPTRYWISQKFQHVKHHGKPLIGPPIIVPPTWNKGSYHSDLINVWKVAAEVLSKAENIIVIGYSLPDTDSFFKYLFALGSQGNTRLKRFWVFNPDAEVASRFENMLGLAAKNRFRFWSSPFEKAIPVLLHELTDAI